MFDVLFLRVKGVFLLYLISPSAKRHFAGMPKAVTSEEARKMEASAMLAGMAVGILS